jgi:hypothetical protein
MLATDQATVTEWLGVMLAGLAVKLTRVGSWILIYGSHWSGVSSPAACAVKVYWRS